MRSVTVNEVPEAAQLIDVREVDEFEAVHAANAVNMPMSNFMSFIDSIDKDREVYLICKSGVRSAQVGQYLDNAGFDPINVEGGTDAWVATGLPTI
ncbi:putative adenylyltransferase/sulfurtransferase MoeZ [Corynebacterium kalinowskii]|uniref:Adenylyltransferase/sulfurtransferase MoeZ n=1 Tax=Corynebacterium kalinowskii TaxID=2675216 RepID=A0A6B8VAE5_9CORY|nr:rhodanese-like domain-containing protein [Corynebacterium kalinowskii]QGU01243.1 putative adenylyltransferase/sulfurtransferase MoeZ [Corynebacterium kalinowskii]